MPTRTARTDWTGSLEQGGGQVGLISSRAGSFPVSFPRRAADDAGGVTSPEELIAAAHSSCFAMALSGQIATAGGTPRSLTVTADVTLRPAAGGGFEITSSALTVRGEVDGLDEAAFVAAAEAAKAGCPVSKALAGTTITLDAALATP
jgi:osmotically inducible protein OsmC